jgi:predicted hydrocarbon binding protein
MESCGQITSSASPKKKAKFAKCLMDNFEKHFPENVRIKVMENCGRSCIGATIIQKAKKIKKNAKNLKELVDGFNKQHIGGGKLKLEGNKIYAVYDRCYCGMVNKAKEKFSSTYCNCSRGWLLELFEKVFEKPVKIDLIESIIQGAKTCKFAIST